MITVSLCDRILTPEELLHSIDMTHVEPFARLATEALALLDERDHALTRQGDLKDELEAVRGVLEAFGALDPTDTTTGLADLLKCLLPPANEL